MKNFKYKTKLDLYEELISLNETKFTLVKNAQDIGNIGSQIYNSIKNFWAEQSSGDIKADLFNLLARGGIKMLIPGPLGWALSLGATALGIDFWGIFKSVYDRIAPEIQSGATIGASKIDSAVDSVIGSSKTASFNKEAGVFDRSILSKIVKFIFTALFAGAASTAAVGVAKKVNVLDMVKPETSKEAPASTFQSTQTKFKINPKYKDILQTIPWVETTTNNEKSIEQMLVRFAKEVYEGLNGLENKMISLPAFQTVKQSIVLNNRDAVGDNIVILPQIYKSKKQVVDYFIDDLAS